MSNPVQLTSDELQRLQEIQSSGTGYYEAYDIVRNRMELVGEDSSNRLFGVIVS